MNTKQLIVLWYAGLLVAAILVFQTSDSIYFLIASIVVFAMLLIYTLKPHPLVNKRNLFIAVISPFVLTALGYLGVYLWGKYQELVATHLIAPETIELKDVKLYRETSDSAFTLAGRIDNHSSYKLTGVDVDIGLYYNNAKVQSIATVISISAFPSESVVFENSISEYEEKMVIAFERQYEFSPSIIGTRGEIIPHTIAANGGKPTEASERRRSELLERLRATPDYQAMTAEKQRQWEQNILHEVEKRKLFNLKDLKEEYADFKRRLAWEKAYERLRERKR